MADSTKKLTSRQTRAVAALMACRNVREAAKVAQVGERTLYRWQTLPAFRDALTEAEEGIMDTAARGLISLQPNAVAALERAATTPNLMIGLRAATAILDYSLKLRKLRSTEQRVRTLERKLADMKGQVPDKVGPQASVSARD